MLKVAGRYSAAVYGPKLYQQPTDRVYVQFSFIRVRGVYIKEKRVVQELIRRIVAVKLAVGRIAIHIDFMQRRFNAPAVSLAINDASDEGDELFVAKRPVDEYLAVQVYLSLHSRLLRW
jgi:hypothetical protein